MKAKLLRCRMGFHCYHETRKTELVHTGTCKIEMHERYEEQCCLCGHTRWQWEYMRPMYNPWV